MYFVPFIAPIVRIRTPKRSLEELNDANADNFDDDSLMNIPIHSLDRATFENSPWMKYLVIRKESVYIDRHLSLIKGWKL